MDRKLIISYIGAFFVFFFWLGGTEILLSLLIACGAFIFLLMFAPRVLDQIFRDDL